MLEFTKKKSDCVGCSACMAACGLHCITMARDEEGFLYPVASDDCVHCGKCRKVCPIENFPAALEPAYLQKAYAAVSKDARIWRRSASGGAFSEICRAFGDSETIICGAAWDGLSVHHICVKGVENIAQLCKSKYVASSLEHVFIEIRRCLHDGRKVIFCGTPCQVAGLKNYLGKAYEKLLLIDIVCHGVGSPAVFKASVLAIGAQLGKKVKAYEFRTKRRVHETDYLSKITFADGKPVYLAHDQYMQLFLSQNCLRPSCSLNCKFRNDQRQGDITIADFKGLHLAFPQLVHSGRNYSSIIVNSTKGEVLISALERSMEMYACSLEVIKQYNPLFYRQTYASEERDPFFVDFAESPAHAISKWSMPAQIYRRTITRQLICMLPSPVRKLLRKVIALFRRR